MAVRAKVCEERGEVQSSVQSPLSGPSALQWTVALLCVILCECVCMYAHIQSCAWMYFAMLCMKNVYSFLYVCLFVYIPFICILEYLHITCFSLSCKVLWVSKSTLKIPYFLLLAKSPKCFTRQQTLCKLREHPKQKPQALLIGGFKKQQQTSSSFLSTYSLIC